MSQKKVYQWLVMAVACGSLLSCGKSGTSADGSTAPLYPTPPVVAPGTNSCPAGQISIAGGPCALDFATACSYAYGVLTTTQGVQVCKSQMTFRYWVGYGSVNYAVNGYFVLNDFRILNPSLPSGPYAYDTGIQVARNDRVEVSASGHWGYPTSSSYSWLGGLITGTTWDTSCDDVSIGGNFGGQQRSYQGMPAGLAMSDNTKVYFVGGGTTFTVENAGSLKFGWNADPATSGGCGQTKITKLVVSRCQAANGALYVCP